MSTDLTPERRAEIEARRDALAARLAESAYAGLEDTWDIMHDFDDLLAALCQKTRECNALAFTARRVMGERDAAVGDAERWRKIAPYVEALLDNVLDSTGETFLPNALIGLHPDATFYSRWKRNKDGLSVLLNAIDFARTTAGREHA